MKLAGRGHVTNCGSSSADGFCTDSCAEASPMTSTRPPDHDASRRRASRDVQTAAEPDGSHADRPARRVGIFHESSGAVVMVGGRCLALRRGDEWVFPKGHLEAGERPEQAAIREVREETGLEVRIVRPIGTTRYEFDGSGSGDHRKRVHWFLAERTGGALRPEAPFTEAVLLDRGGVAAVLTHQADRELAARAFDIVDANSLGSRPRDQGREAETDPAPPAPDRFPNVVEIVVEIPRGSRNKYEWDEDANVLRLDRVLSSSVFYNFDYAFVDGTRVEDGDHTDALLLVDEPIFPGCHVEARPVGGLEMSDENGFDFKVLCVAVGDPLYRHVTRLDQIEPHRLLEIENFFATYKLLENKEVDVVGWRDVDRASELLLLDRARYVSEGREASS
jgi:inorganic pyrophosphatase